MSSTGSSCVRRTRPMMGKLWPLIFLAGLMTSCRSKFNASASDEQTQQLATVRSSADMVCECVQYPKCNKNGTYVTDGAKMIHYKMGVKVTKDGQDSANRIPNTDVKVRKCPPGQRWCCGKPLNPGQTTTIDDVTTIKPADVTPTPKPPVVVTYPSTIVPTTIQCGKRMAPIINYKTVSGKDADFGEFPWMVMVLQNEELNGELLKRYKCGGSLIHERVVITAAHCAAKISKELGVVRAGERDVSDYNETYSHQDRSLSQIITHPGFDRSTMENDISLLVASEPFKLGFNVGIVCLPRANDVVTDATCKATGWGKNSSGFPQSILNKVDLPMVPTEECLSRLKATRQFDDEFTLHESFICAGGIEGKDTCQGDGGSPLVCPIKGEKGRFQQIGIVAWGVGCGTSVPAVYVNVPLFRNWIDDQMSQLGFKTDYGY